MSNKVSVQVKWDGAKIGQIERQVIKGLFWIGTDIGNQARRNAPYKTGALSNSIRVVPNGAVVEVIAGGKMGGKNIPYAAIQEFGGYAGRHHSARITGKHYMKRAANYIMSGDYLKRYFGGIV